MTKENHGLCKDYFDMLSERGRKILFFKIHIALMHHISNMCSIFNPDEEL